MRTQTRDQTIALLGTGRVAELSLDYDLEGDDEYGRGIEVVDWMAQQQVDLDRDLWPRDGIILHTSNPHREQMQRSIVRYARELHAVRVTMTPDGKRQILFAPLGSDR